MLLGVYKFRVVGLMELYGVQGLGLRISGLGLEFKLRGLPPTTCILDLQLPLPWNLV